jgi:hypothetical protein
MASAGEEVLIVLPGGDYRESGKWRGNAGTAEFEL